MIKIADLPFKLNVGMNISHSVPCFNGSYTYNYEVVGLTVNDKDHQDAITLVSEFIPPMDVEPEWFLQRKIKFT